MKRDWRPWVKWILAVVLAALAARYAGKEFIFPAPPETLPFEQK